MTVKSFLICLSIPFYLLTCKSEKKEVKQTEITFKKEGELLIHKIKTDSSTVALEIEIADTDFDIQTGLMYRSSMKTNRGMLFVFDDVAQRSFYMKNTKFPLDLIFIDENKIIVSFQKNAKPFDESSLPSGARAKYVLEINAGMVDTWRLTVGDSLSYTE